MSKFHSLVHKFVFDVLWHNAIISLVERLESKNSIIFYTLIELYFYSTYLILFATGYYSLRQFILPGHIYRDCAGHPVLCTEVSLDGVCGVSLIDGSRPRSCSIKHCEVERISLSKAERIKDNWAQIYSEQRGKMITLGYWEESARTKYLD